MSSQPAPRPPEDITKRLQFWKHHSEAYAPHPTWRFHTDLDEACAEIGRLHREVEEAINRAELAELRAPGEITKECICPTCGIRHGVAHDPDDAVPF
jgi:hypothetical protein